MCHRADGPKYVIFGAFGSSKAMVSVEMIAFDGHGIDWVGLAISVGMMAVTDLEMGESKGMLYERSDDD